MASAKLTPECSRVERPLMQAESSLACMEITGDAVVMALHRPASSMVHALQLIQVVQLIPVDGCTSLCPAMDLDGELNSGASMITGRLRLANNHLLRGDRSCVATFVPAYQGRRAVRYMHFRSSSLVDLWN